MGFKRWAVWWRAFRFHYASASFMPGILGGMIAWTTDGEFHPGYFLLVLLGLTLNHCALNMTDDYYDFRHLVDALATDRENPYTGGSGTLSTGLIEPKAMRNVFSVFYVIAIGIGILLGIMRGPFVLFLLAIGFFCAFFYTAPPIRFGYRGLGEIAQLLCFGPGIGLGAYYVQTQRISWEAFWGTLPFGIMLFSMITINEIPDYLEDRESARNGTSSPVSAERRGFGCLPEPPLCLCGDLDRDHSWKDPCAGFDLTAHTADRVKDGFHSEGSLSGPCQDGSGQPGDDMYP